MSGQMTIGEIKNVIIKEILGLKTVSILKAQEAL